MQENSNGFNAASSEIGRLTELLFVFHAWQNLPLIGPDGVMFHLDTQVLDVDNESSWKMPDGSSGVAGLAYLKRLRMLPINATQKGVINNREGFAITNVFLGTVGQDGQTGIGSNMSGAMKTNVKSEWVYPAQKVMDMTYTFGKYGLVHLNSLRAADEREYLRCRRIFDAVMSGMDDRTLVEDMPEYFGEVSPYLLDKPAARFRVTAEQALDSASLSDDEKHIGARLIEELKGSVLAAHSAALDAEQAGILPMSREARESGMKKAWDKCDLWLMGQFPSFPMDTELEKSNKQIIKALEGGDRQAQAVADDVGVDDLLAQLKEERARNDRLEDRLDALEAAQTATAGAGSPEGGQASQA